MERLCRLLTKYNIAKLPLLKPLGIVIRVTERCFLRCKMCGQNSEKGRLKGVSNRDRQRISPEVMASMVKEIRSWRLKPFIKLTGGEPLIEWKILLPHIAEFRKMGCVIKLNTNAVLLKNRQLAYEVVKTGVDYLSISIDGTKDTHNQVRGISSAFDNSKKGIQNIIKEKKAQRAKYPMVLLSSVVSTLNEHDIVNMAQLASEWRVDWLNIQFLNFLTPERSKQAYKVLSKCFGTTETPWTGFELTSLTNIDAVKLSSSIDIIENTAQCPVSIMKIGNSPEALKKFHYTDEVINTHICHMPFATMFIVPQSHPVFCIDYPYYIYGDLNKQSLEETWFGQKAQFFRHSLAEYYKEHGTNYPQCLRCNWPFNS
jgi:sulfatase maturation enzyme AslB (radical SAM superfamily)